LFLQQKNAYSGSGVTVVGSKQVFNLEAGKTGESSLKIINTSNSKTEYELYFNDFTYREDGVKDGYTEFGFIPETSVKNYVSVSELNFILEPKEEKLVFLSVSVPEGEDVGSKYSVLFVSSKPEKIDDGVSGIAANPRIAVPVILNILPEGSLDNPKDVINKKIAQLKYSNLEQTMDNYASVSFYDKNEKNIFKRFDWRKFSIKEIFSPKVEVEFMTKIKNTGSVAFETPEEGSYQKVSFNNSGKNKVFTIPESSVMPSNSRIWKNEYIFENATFFGNINLSTRLYIESEKNYLDSNISQKINAPYINDLILIILIVLIGISLIIFAYKFFKRKNKK